MNYKFERVVSNDKQISKLYELLKLRKDLISHASLPNYEEHSRFVKNHPYLHWFMVTDKNDYFGSFYIKKDNSIGLNLTLHNKEILEACINFIRKNFNPQAAQVSVIPDLFFYINVAYSNKKRIKALKELGMLPLQFSLRI